MTNELVSMKVYDNGAVIGNVKVNKKALLVAVKNGNNRKLLLGPRGKKIRNGVLLFAGIVGVLGMGSYAANQYLEVENIPKIVDELGPEEYNDDVVNFIYNGLLELKQDPDLYDDSIAAIEQYISSIDFYEKDNKHLNEYKEPWTKCIESCLGILNRAGIDYKINNNIRITK